MENGREHGKIYAPRPGKPVMVRRDTRSELDKQRDRTNGAEIYETLCVMARSQDTERFIAAREGFHRLPEGDQRYLKSILHRSSRLCLLLLQGEWTKASTVLSNLAPALPDPDFSHEVAVRLGLFEENDLEDRRTHAGIDQIAA